MISSLSGTLLSKGDGHIVLNVSGVGFLILVSDATGANLRVGKEYQITTRLIVREDALTLFGFLDEQSAEVFDSLITVSGVGPKSALAVLNTLSPKEITSSVKNADEKAFQKVSGIGPKSARLIIASLSGKLPDLSDSSAGDAQSNIITQLTGALQNLGWSEREVNEQIQQLKSTGEFDRDLDISALLRLALSKLGAK